MCSVSLHSLAQTSNLCLVCKVSQFSCSSKMYFPRVRVLLRWTLIVISPKLLSKTLYDVLAPFVLQIRDVSLLMRNTVIGSLYVIELQCSPLISIIFDITHRNSTINGNGTSIAKDVAQACSDISTKPYLILSGNSLN